LCTLKSPAWRVIFRPLWCCLLLWLLKIRIGLTSILDFWYSGPSYLVQESYCTLLFCLYVVSCTQKMRWRAHSSADRVPLLSTIFQCSSEPSKKWGTGLPCLRP
jgi:hypothetical protein